MLFHQKSQKFMRVTMLVIGVLVIISMVLLSVPAWQ